MSEAAGTTIVAPPARQWTSRLGFGALTLAAVALFVTAGNWQRDRMHEKQALRERFDAAAAAAPVPLPASRPADEWTQLRFRPVSATGEFDGRRQILIDNRVHAGQAGYEVVAPLALHDGRHVLVDRGWVAQGRSRSDLPDVAPPAGEVTVHGRIGIPPARYFELGSGQPRGALWQHLDPAKFAQATGIDVLPVVIEQTASAAPGDALVRERPAPDFGIDQHRIYMVQWYSFAALAVTLYAFLTVRGARSPRSRDG